VTAGAEFRRDREFLPAALEILENPASPTRRALLLTLCSFVTVSLAWSFLGRIDIEAVAQGKVEPQGRVKVIEPLEPGRVLNILVEDGAHVHAGDPMIELDPVEARADETAAQQALAVDLADAARYRAALAAVAEAGATIGQTPTIVWDDRIPEMLRTREEAALSADLDQLTRTLRNLDMQMAEHQATFDQYAETAAADAKLVETLQERVDMRQELMRRSAGTKADLIDSLKELERAQSSLVTDRGQKAQAAAAINTVSSEKAKTISQFVADNRNKLNDAVNKADGDVQSLAKAQSRARRTTMRSPVEGVVQQLAVTTIGQVVTTGQELMVIVPGSGALQIEAFVDNADVGFVKPGQEVVVKLDAFPFTRYGTIKGKVVSIATDAIDQAAARRLQANATSLANSANLQPSSDAQDQKFVFPIVVALDRTTFAIGDREISLTPGMSVTAEIKTDSQRIIQYVLSPLARMASEALHER
jgi:hemolysin D